MKLRRSARDQTPASRRARRARLFHLVWTDEDFETVPADVVIGSAELGRWPGIEPDPAADERIARDALEGWRRAKAAEGATQARPAPPPERP